MDPQVLDEVRRLVAPEPDGIVAARARSARLAPPAPEIGALLRWAILTTDARAVVEVGTAGGVSALWILQALSARGVLTSIEPDTHAHSLATDAIATSGRADRVRAILGEPATVLARLTDAAYDVAVLQGRPTTSSDLAHARRLLRPGGVLLCRGLLRPGEHGEELARVVDTLANDPGLAVTVLPIDDGLALATRLEDPTELADAAAESVA